MIKNFLILRSLHFLLTLFAQFIIPFLIINELGVEKFVLWTLSFVLTSFVLHIDLGISTSWSNMVLNSRSTQDKKTSLKLESQFIQFVVCRSFLGFLFGFSLCLLYTSKSDKDFYLALVLLSVNSLQVFHSGLETIYRSRNSAKGTYILFLNLLLMLCSTFVGVMTQSSLNVIAVYILTTQVLTLVYFTHDLDKDVCIRKLLHPREVVKVLPFIKRHARAGASFQIQVLSFFISTELLLLVVGRYFDSPVVAEIRILRLVPNLFLSINSIFTQAFIPTFHSLFGQKDFHLLLTRFRQLIVIVSSANLLMFFGFITFGSEAFLGLFRQSLNLNLIQINWIAVASLSTCVWQVAQSLSHVLFPKNHISLLHLYSSLLSLLFSVLICENFGSFYLILITLLIPFVLLLTPSLKFYFFISKNFKGGKL